MLVTNMSTQTIEASNRIKIPEQVLASTLYQPFRGMNSGSRALMVAVHQTHKLNLINGVAPIIATANENEALKYASSYITAKCNKMIIGRVNKFTHMPNLHYWYITVNIDGPEEGDLDVIEAVDYVHTTESYGYRLNKAFLDGLGMGQEIHTGDVERIPANVDEYGNVGFGINLMTAYTSNLITQDDGYCLSETAASMMGTELYHFVPIQLNDNDIMLNLYHNDEVAYKAMPDIGEEIKDGTLLAIRRQNNADAMYSQTWEMLKTIIPPIDKKYSLNGTLIDIEIYSNNYDQLANGPNSIYHTQINGYLNNKYRYCNEICQYVDEYIEAHPDKSMSPILRALYIHARDTVNHVDHYKNGKKYSGTIIHLIVREHLPLKQGDKITNRYGGKGVIAKILPDYMMPIIGDQRIHVLMNKGTVNGRLNYGQTMEMEINFRSRMFLNHIFALPLSTNERLEAIRDYLSHFSKNFADFFWKKVEETDESERRMLLDSYTEDGIIRMALKPLSDRITIDTLIEVDKAYPWITQEYIKSPIINSNGKLRYIEKSVRPIVAGEEFFYRLKQYAEEKFSVTSISTVNLRNENSKSRAGKLYEAPFADTPIKFGSMETESSTHMDEISEGIVSQMLMIYSSSSEARNGLVNLYFGNPIEIDIELDSESTSRSAEIFNVYFKQIGNRIRFEKYIKDLADPPFKIDMRVKPPFYVKEEEKVKPPYKFKDDKVLVDPPFKIKEGMIGLHKIWVEDEREKRKHESEDDNK